MKTITAQLPERLYQQVEQVIQHEHLSVDQLVTIALSAQVSAWLTKDYFRERAERGSWEKFQRVLEKVPLVEPEEYDAL